MTPIDNIKLSHKRAFTLNFIGGVGWMLGITLGATFILLFLSQILGLLGGLPLVGSFFADLIVITNNALRGRL
jgi:hypothetical protein